jgi:hypothetical protein
MSELESDQIKKSENAGVLPDVPIKDAAVRAERDGKPVAVADTGSYEHVGTSKLVTLVRCNVFAPGITVGESYWLTADGLPEGTYLCTFSNKTGGVDGWVLAFTQV